MESGRGRSGSAMVQTLRKSWEEEEAKAACQPRLPGAGSTTTSAPTTRFAEVKSRRINSAIAGLTRQRSDLDRDQDDAKQRPNKPRRPRKKKSTASDPSQAAQSPVDGGDDKENEQVASPATDASTVSPQSGRRREVGGVGVRGRGRGAGRGRGGLGNEVAERLRLARAEKAREDAEWLDDDVQLVGDDDDAGDDGDWQGSARGRGRGRGRGEVAEGAALWRSVAVSASAVLQQDSGPRLTLYHPHSFINHLSSPGAEVTARRTRSKVPYISSRAAMPSRARLSAGLTSFVT